MSHKLSDGLQKQISKATLFKNKPLLITDADEVLLNFVKCFETYLEKKGFWYDLTSYALFGNIKQKGTDEVSLDTTSSVPFCFIFPKRAYEVRSYQNPFFSK